ncbi:MAG: endonuclease [Oscillospiraceae bacterium]|nr:endonuclease [Oscillospiraceae bacterium]
MKQVNPYRPVALLLCLFLILSLLGGTTVFAANDEIWIEAPTGWRHGSHVKYETVDGHLCNWGVRGEPALFLTDDAIDYYSDNPWGVGYSWGYFMWQEYEGGTGIENAPDSPLYQQLHQLMEEKHTHKTSYSETRDLYRYTDCMVNSPDSISSFYSGRKLNGAWDSGATWNREHTWPQSKSTGEQKNDIMMLRPTSIQENSDRGNLAYGESSGFYNPNAEANGQFDLRGDCARICLYCYVRWSENADQMWGADGVMESLDVLLNWMAEDPVDTWEMGRNDAVQDITGVRNVFVDYPELAWYLFGRELPGGYPTPLNGGGEWPPASAVQTEFSAVPDDPDHGSVQVSGLCATPHPAEGWYVSGYDVISANPWYMNGDDPAPYAGLLQWDRYGRLLCLDRWEVSVSVTIHFTPIGETDPCPTGHKLNFDDPEIVTEPTCTENGQQRLSCERCGKSVLRPLSSLGHDWDDGVVIVPATVEESGTIKYSCRRCGESYETYYYFEFDDVKDTAKYYYFPVYWALYHSPQITAGSDAAHFSPAKPCTREQIVTFLWKAAGAPKPEATSSPFRDVNSGKYYFDAVLWAVENEITGGVGGGKFGVGQPCTREQAVTFLWKACGSPKPNSTETPFEDVNADKYYCKPVLWAVENGITSGMGNGNFGVGKTCTRGQIVTFLYAASDFLSED